MLIALNYKLIDLYNKSFLTVYIDISLFLYIAEALLLNRENLFLKYIIV